MLTEQNTPLPLVRQWSNLIPHCWEDLDELADKTRATQPSNMAADAELYAAMSIVQAHAVNGALPVEISHASFELFCCALWRRNKVVYTFDDTLAAELVQQADEWDDSDNLPIEVLLHPPYRCAFISCSGVIDPEIIGFFPFIVRDMDKGTPVFYVCVVYKTFSTLTMPLHLNGLTVGDCINATTKAANRAKHPDGYEVNLDRTTILRYLNLYLYICAANADIASTPAQTYRPRSAAAPIRDRFREVQSYDTGLAIGSALRRAQAEEKNTKAQQRGTARRRSGHIRTHTRRGHWHHFWTGSKSKPESRKVVLRWLHPMLVGRSDEPDTTTVHPVQ